MLRRNAGHQVPMVCGEVAVCIARGKTLTLLARHLLAAFAARRSWCAINFHGAVLDEHGGNGEAVIGRYCSMDLCELIKNQPLPQHLQTLTHRAAYKERLPIGRTTA